MGGTFDPIHRGHTHLADQVLKTFSLDRVLFMVSNLPPYKDTLAMTSPFHRYAMVILEILGKKRFYTSQWELTHQGFSYTIDTLRHFTSTCPSHRFGFIAGSDSLKEIHLWKDYDRLLEKYTLIFVQRPGAEVDLHTVKLPDPLKARIRLVQKGEHPAIEAGRSFLASLRTLPVSSTSIRQTIASKRQPSPESVAPAVLRYIRKYQLYEKDENGS